MRDFKHLLIILLLNTFFLTFITAQTKPIYQVQNTTPEVSNRNDPFLIGNEKGLFKILSNNTMEQIWKDSQIIQIHRTSYAWYFVTDKGILTSKDLVEFQYINNGIPSLTIKTFENGETALEKKSPLIKDFNSDPLNPNILVTATKDGVYLSTDYGQNWKNIGSMSKKTGGIKAVAVCHMPVYDQNDNIYDNQLVVTMSHPLFGFSYYIVNESKPQWTDVEIGFEKLPTLPYVDEISDIIPVVRKAKNGTPYCDLYISQTYIPNIYSFDWKEKKAVKIFKGAETVETIDSLCQSASNLIYVSVDNVCSYNLSTKITKTAENFSSWKKYLTIPGCVAQTAYIPSNITKLSTPLCLSELWLINSKNPSTPYYEKAEDKKAIYASAYQLRTDEGISKYKTIIKENNLNAMVVDMKDDNGYLRFQPNSPLIREKGIVTVYKVNLDKMINEFKKDDVYLIARIVVFKDPVLARYSNHMYAVKDKNTNEVWQGIKSYPKITTDENGQQVEVEATYYDEIWVDPYCHEVWEYNIEIAKELLSRGFDEIQFDYIRFPTDGLNLSDTVFTWKEVGMDKESALISFLKYARQNLDAPIGVDIYGANGWYRSGARTGQDVELMSDYVDVICPMFYPSHFEQNFLDIPPREERPYRIYYYGSYRNTIMARNKIIVRPWVQAFKLYVSYDKYFYNKDYVNRQIYGIKDSVNHGYMYWNNSGRYDDISPDSSEDSPWKNNEADLHTRVPAIGSKTGGK